MQSSLPQNVSSLNIRTTYTELGINGQFTPNVLKHFDLMTKLNMNKELTEDEKEIILDELDTIWYNSTDEEGMMIRRITKEYYQNTKNILNGFEQNSIYYENKISRSERKEIIIPPTITVQYGK